MSQSTYNSWTTGEARLLSRLYPSSMPAAALYAAFPRHTKRSIQAYARCVLKVSRPPSLNPPRAARAWDEMREILKRETLTARALAARCGVSRQRVSELLIIHRSEIYIADWLPPVLRGQWRAVWAYGDHPDAEQPFSRYTFAARDKCATSPRGVHLCHTKLARSATSAPGHILQQPTIADDEVGA